MFTSGFRPKSNTKKAKNIIRKEMLSYFDPKEYGTKTRLAAMKKDADSGNGGVYGNRKATDYQKGAYLVDAGCLAIWDQYKMLGKIYGKNNVKNWTNDKKHNVYKHLIGREFASMLKEKRKRK